MRLLLSGGGTGGHVYPALAVVEELRMAPSQAGRTAAGRDGLSELMAVVYAGTVGGLEANLVARAGVPFWPVQAAGLRGLSPRQILTNSFRLLEGSVQAWSIIRQFRPDVVLATGGYACAPVVVAAWLRRCPVLIYLPDVQPGLAVRFLSRLAKKVAVSFDVSLKHFSPGKAVVTGYPVRSGLYGAHKEAAKERLGLDREVKTVLVFGGSRGAHSINQAVSQALEPLLGSAQVVHIAGDHDFAWLHERREGLPAGFHQRYRLYDYLHEEMIDALAAADLAVARAGAATMGEFAAAGLPSILVPYPYSGQHQEANADFMASCGASVKVHDAELAQGALPAAVQKLLIDDQTLRSMAASARKLARPDAAQAIARHLSLLAGGA